MWLQMTAMWAVMMVPMMLPSLAPRLWAWRAPRLALVAALAYFLVWAACGAALYPPTMAHPLPPTLAFAACGALQLTPWKSRALARCRTPPAPRTPRAAWWAGTRMGLDCTLCCAGYILILLALGAMNLIVMLAVTAAITLERLTPWPRAVAWAVGAGAGVWAVVAAVQGGVLHP